jgi:microcystin-dependent protein
MSDPYVGEIRMFGGNFAPAGWMFCSGQLLPISEYETLFNLIGTTYGGDGQSTFNLPNLGGRVPVHQGTDSFGISYVLGANGGAENVILTVNQIAAHTHALLVSGDQGDQNTPGGNEAAAGGSAQVYRPGTATSALNAAVVTTDGLSQPHSNFQPYLCVSFIISLFGIYPSQN